MFPTNKSPKISYKFFCETCNYKCNKQSEITKHNFTRKHKILQNPTSDTTSKSHICKCGKVYKHTSTLYAHKKKCSIAQGEENSNTNTTQPTHNNTNNTNNTSISSVDVDKELLIKMLLKNQDVMEGILLKNQDFMEKMMEIMPQIGNQINNTNT